MCVFGRKPNTVCIAIVFLRICVHACACLRVFKCVTFDVVTVVA